MSCTRAPFGYNCPLPNGHSEPCEPVVVDPTDLLDYRYQAEATDAIAGGFLDAGVWAQLLVLPTGSGKTHVFAGLKQHPRLALWLAQYPYGRARVLVLAHRDELINQAVEKLRAANPDMIVGIEAADQTAGPMCDIVVGSVPTLAARDCARLRALGVDTIRILIIDEAHHSTADQYQSILRCLNLLPPTTVLPQSNTAAHSGARAAMISWWKANPRETLLLGVTATPSRADAVGLEWTFQQIIYERTLRWMIEQGYLSPLAGYLVDTDVSLDAVRTLAGEFNQGQLANTVNTPARNRAIADAWEVQAYKDGVTGWMKTLGFTVDRQHARDLAEAFRQQGHAADFVTGDMAIDERRAKIAAFKAGTINPLFNAQLLTEGYDEPSIECLIMAKPTKSSVLFMQMVGRGTRLFPGKPQCLVLDVVDVTRKHSLMTTGDLFGLPHGFDLKGQNALDALKKIEALQAQYPTLSVDDVHSLDEIKQRISQVDLWQPAAAKGITPYARLAWVSTGDLRFSLNLPALRAPSPDDTSSEKARPERIDLRADQLGTWRGYRIIGTQPEPLIVADTIADAFARAEKWVAIHRPDVFRVQAQDAGWRKQPASEKQIRFLYRIKAKVHSGITRGEASALIDKHLAK